MSLAVSDLLLLVSGLPQEVYSIWIRYPYAFGEAFCVLRGLAAESSANASVLTITAFTVERYLAICKPFTTVTRTITRAQRALKLIAGVWAVALCCAFVQVGTRTPGAHHPWSHWFPHWFGKRIPVRT